MPKRNKDMSVCREDKRTQWEKDRDERVKKTIHTYPLSPDAWKSFEPYNRMETVESK